LPPEARYIQTVCCCEMLFYAGLLRVRPPSLRNSKKNFRSSRIPLPNTAGAGWARAHPWWARAHPWWLRYCPKYLLPAARRQSKTTSVTALIGFRQFAPHHSQDFDETWLALSARSRRRNSLPADTHQTTDTVRVTCSPSF